MIVESNRCGEQIAIASWCTAHALTLRAILDAHRDDDDPILIETTGNEVNQFGGSSGMTPATFRKLVENTADEADVDARRIILGGHQLGPGPWKNRSASAANGLARDMVRAYVEAGFTKLHFDASVACSDESEVSERTSAERVAGLCAAAEGARTKRAPIAYVLEANARRGARRTVARDALSVTRPDDVVRSVDLHRAAFADHGITDALKRVIALVVQPGHAYGNSTVVPFDMKKRATLNRAALKIPGLAFEAHSADYQREASLALLVASRVAILKVGPELAFAFREAIFAMAEIEIRLEGRQRSGVISVLETAMDENVEQCSSQAPTEANERVDRLFDLNDLARHSWSDPRVIAALKLLFANIDSGPVHPGLISQFAGEVAFESSPAPLSQRIIASKVGATVRRFRRACAPIII